MFYVNSRGRGGHNRRPASEIPILEPVEIAKICERANTTRDECMIALLYLSGRRIGEILPLQKQSFNVSKPGFTLAQNNYIVSFITKNEKSWRTKKTGNFSIPVVKGDIVKYYEKIEPRFSMRGPSGKALGQYVLDYLTMLRNDDFLFRPERLSTHDYITRQQAYKILRKIDDRLWLHAIRHMTFTRMADQYTDDPVEMHRLTFHRQFKSTLEYIQAKKAEDKLEKI